MRSKLIKVHRDDNVAIALVDLWQGNRIGFEGGEVIVLDDVSAKHKIAMLDLAVGDKIYMYGVLVGKAMRAINKGGVLTTENVRHEAAQTFTRTETTSLKAPDISKWKYRTFMGYHREDGQVGTANIWLFFPLVFCENRNVELLKDVFEKEFTFHRSPKQRQLLRNLINGKEEDAAVDFEEVKTSVFDNIEAKFITHQGAVVVSVRIPLCFPSCWRVMLIIPMWQGRLY